MKYCYLLLMVSYVLSYKLPEGVTFCHRSQKNFSECVGKKMQNSLGKFASGINEMGVPAVDPYVIEKLIIKPSNPSKNIALHMVFSNIHVYGISKTDINNMKINFDNGCGWELDALSPLVTLEGYYELKGKLLIFPVNAHGKCNIKIVGLLNKHKMWCEKYAKNGITYIRFTNYTMKMQPEKIICDFSDLFPSNRDIEKEIVNTLNQNDVATFAEIRSAFEEVFSTIHIQVANKIFSKIPFDEVFLP